MTSIFYVSMIIAKGNGDIVSQVYHCDIWKKLNQKMNKAETDQLLDKITEGVKLSIRRLIERTKKEDGELVFSENGKIVRVKARDLKTDN